MSKSNPKLVDKPNRQVKDKLLKFGSFKIKAPEWAIPNHHKGRDKLNDYEHTVINRRIKTKEPHFEVKKGSYQNTGDIDGTTSISWIEAPNDILRNLTINNAVNRAVDAAKKKWGSFGKAVGSVIKKVADASMLIAVERLLTMERKYELSFRSDGRDNVSETDKKAINDANKGEIAQALAKIGESLDDHKDKSFDLDGAKEELDELSKECQGILSNKNKDELKRLASKHEAKFKEYSQIIKDNHKKILDKIDSVFNALNEKLQELEKSRASNHESEINNFGDVIQKLIDSAADIEKKFKDEIDDMQTKHTEILNSEENVQDKIEELHNEYIEKFQQAEDEVNELNDQIGLSLEQFHSEILQSRERAEESFRLEQIRRQEIFTQSQQLFDEVVVNYHNHTEKMMQNFRDAAEHEINLHESHNQSLAAMRNNILESRDMFEKNFRSAHEHRNKVSEIQLGNITKLKLESEEYFIEAFEDSKKQAKEIEYEVFKFTEEADKQFELAEKDARAKYGETEHKLKVVSEEVLKSREEADRQFGLAAKDRKEKFEAEEHTLMQVENEVFKSRKEADKQFELAAKDMQTKHDETEKNLKKTHKEVLESRKVADEQFLEAKKQVEEFHQKHAGQLNNLSQDLQEMKNNMEANFKKAEEHCNKIYEETSVQLQAVDKNVNAAREEINVNFKKAKEHCNEIYAKTSVQLKAVNENVNRAKKEIDANFKKAEEYCNKIYAETDIHLKAVNESVNATRNEIDTDFKKAEEHCNKMRIESCQKLGEIKSNILHKNLCIELLAARKDNFSMFENLIKENKHPKILEIKNKQKDTNGLAMLNQNQAINEIKVLIEEFNDSSEEAALNKAMDISIKSASLYGHSYDVDIFRLSTLLSMKNKLNFDKEVKKILDGMHNVSSDVMSLVFEDEYSYQNSMESLIQKSPQELQNMINQLILANDQATQNNEELDVDNQELMLQIKELSNLPVKEILASVKETIDNFDMLLQGNMGEFYYEYK